MTATIGLFRLALILSIVALGTALPARTALAASPPPQPSGPPIPTPDPTLASPGAPASPQPAPPRAIQQPAGLRPSPGSLAAQHQAQHAAQIAATRSAHQAANSARRAAQAAAAEKAAEAEWRQTGEPGRLIVVRPHVIDVVRSGHLTSRIKRAAGPVSLRSLAPYVPSGWLTISGDTAVLSTTLALTANSALVSDVAALRLSVDPDPASAASIWVGQGSLSLKNVLVTSWDSGSQQAPPASVARRAFLVVGAGGHLDASGTTLSDLGATAGSPGGGDHVGVVFAPGSSGSLVQTRFLRNLVGLKLSGSTNVLLDRVTVDHSTGDGLVLHNDRGTTLRAVDVTNNGGNGVLVTGGAGDRVLTGINASGNGAFGVALIRPNHLQVTGIATSADRSGGLRLTGCTTCSVTGTTARNEPVAVLVNGTGSQIAIQHVQAHGGELGLVLDHGVTDVDVSDLTVDHARTTGVAVAASRVQLRGLTVSDSIIGVRLSRTAARVTLAGSTVVGGRDGIVASRGATEVTLRSVVVRDVGHDALNTAAADTTITGGRITGGKIGINARASTGIEATSVSGVMEGVHVARGVTVRGNRVDVLATSSGIKVEPRGRFLLNDSRVRAREPLRGAVVLEGHDTVSLPPFPWVGFMGVVLVAVAVLLETLNTIRDRLTGRRPPTAISAPTVVTLAARGARVDAAMRRAGRPVGRHLVIQRAQPPSGGATGHR